MYMICDIYGRELTRGDYITYAVKHSTEIEPHTAQVISINEELDGYGRTQAKISVVTTKNDYNRRAHTYNWRAYKATLTSTTTIIRISEDSVPVFIKEIIHENV